MQYGGPPPREHGRPHLYPKPKSLREVPHYLWQVVSGFFTRLFYIVRLVWETSPPLMILMCFLCLSAGVLPVAGAYIGRELLNAVNDVLLRGGVDLQTGLLASLKGTLAAVAVFLLMQFVYLFFNRIVNRIQNTVNSMAGELVSNHIKLKLMNKSKTVDLAGFDRPEFYEKLENANREAGIRPLMILQATFSVISALISAVSFIVILFHLGWLMPLLVLVLAVPTAIVNYIFRRRNFWYVRRRSKDRRQMNYYADIVTNKDLVKEMRLMDLSDTFIDKYSHAFRRYYAGLRRMIITEGIWQVVTALISLVAEAVLFFYIAYHVVENRMDIGDYSLFAGALTSIGGYVSIVISSSATIYEGTLFIDNVMTYMKEKPTVISTLTPPREPARHGKHTIEMRDVSFRYPGTGRDVIHRFSATFSSGERILLVGLNGAGKTTLIKLLTRLYDPTEGCILLDGHDMREYEPKALYRLFGTIFQDFGTYALTVEENIAIGNTGAKNDPEGIRRAAEKANADEFIDSLPGGYDTPLMRYFEENATELSIGQWQKLSIARAFYADSDILIMDEPTASLDAMAEQEIFDRFAALAEDKLTILVSHRLSSAAGASKILVIENGCLVECGTHDELMKKSGAYHTLFTTQAKHYVTAMNGEEYPQESSQENGYSGTGMQGAPTER